jgi:tetratricopeptide (TPR) repeat protein
MRRIIVAAVVALALGTGSVARSESDETQFRANLSQMLTNIEKSVTILRQQIAASRKAGFAPDLYLELALLLSQKSVTLYYIGKEKQAMGEIVDNKKASPIVSAQKEAIDVLQDILNNYPRYDKRADVLYSLANGYNAIDEGPAFVRTVQKLKKEYPGSDQAIRASLLMGQYFFEKDMYGEAVEEWTPTSQLTRLPEERNLARYRVGLAYMRTNKPKEALKSFEAVALDPDAAAAPKETRVSLDKRQASADIRRDALLDAIIPYTTIFGTQQDPVKYFAKLAPTEVIFQEVLEKLAFRYIYLKNYEFALGLLRTLTKRMSDVQKSLVIYYDVLRTIPVKSRLDISANEMRYVLERLNAWQSYYQPDSGVRDQVLRFFEIQLRDLGTRSHQLAKDGKSDSNTYKNAQAYYKLYLAYFPKNPNANKIAANLAELNLSQKNYLECGNYYLEAASGTYGAATNANLLVKNAIACLDKPDESPYFEQIRKRGLLVRAITTYQSLDPKMAADPLLRFALARAIFESGNIEKGLGSLKHFVQQFPKHELATTAGEIILDHYNKIDDFSGLAHATRFLQKAGMTDAKFTGRLAQIQTQATAKVLEEKVKTYGEFDSFSQGKSYLHVAASSDDSMLRSSALQAALEKSRTEGDFETFFAAGVMMLEAEKNAEQRNQVLFSLAKERRNLGFYAEAIQGFLDVAAKAADNEQTRQIAFEEALNTALLAKDVKSILQISQQPQWKLLGPAIRRRVSELFIDLLVSPQAVSDGFSHILVDEIDRESSIPALIKGSQYLSQSLRSNISSTLESICSKGRQRLSCRWNAFLALEDRYQNLRQLLLKGSRAMSGLEGNATQFQTLWVAYQELQGSRDPDLESAVVLRCHWLFTNFARYLSSMADSSADLKQVLQPKVQESVSVAAKYRTGCQQLAKGAALFSPAARLCMSKEEPLGPTLYSPKKSLVMKGLLEKPATASEIKQARGGVFLKKGSRESILEMADAFYRNQQYHHASAAASFGTALFPDAAPNFRAVLGCATAALGLRQEATFHLEKASDYNGLKTRCMASLQALEEK